MRSLPDDDDDEDVDEMTGVEEDEVSSLHLESVFILTSVSAGLNCGFTARGTRAPKLSTEPNGRFCTRPSSWTVQRDSIPWIRRANDHNCLGATATL
jgi:hypothetical protein